MRRFAVAFGAFSIALVLGSCATAKMWQATGGSRADGVVRLSYDYMVFEAPVVDALEGQRLASARCSAWGYDLAQPFGGQSRICLDNGMDGCMSYRVTKEYQCINLPAA